MIEIRASRSTRLLLHCLVLGIELVGFHEIRSRELEVGSTRMCRTSSHQAFTLSASIFKMFVQYPITEA